VILLIALLILKQLILRSITKTSKDLQNELRSVVQPKFLDISVALEEILELAVEVWRLEIRLAKVDQLPENYSKATAHSVSKFKRYLSKHDIEIIDYTGQKFNDGLNVEVLNYETDTSVVEPYIKETFEPSLMVRGELVKRAKVIVVKN
jgi:molecular chaperone GrpE (heat shock protein)